jgi:hypothetical protein
LKKPLGIIDDLLKSIFDAVGGGGAIPGGGKLRKLRRRAKSL